MSFDFAAARANMVDSQVRPSDVTDPRIHHAMRTLRREDFMPEGKRHLAYADVQVEYAPGRFLLKPRDVAKLLQALEPQAGERALAIAAPYAAAALESMGVAVTRQDEGDLKTVEGDGYDLVVCESAVAKAPAAWLAALRPGGRLGVVERNGVSRAVVYPHGATAGRPAFDAAQNFLAGFKPQHGFAF
jgi:protein-L-isoaspartate(D-aspartate) O-methyltransferase